MQKQTRPLFRQVAAVLASLFIVSGVEHRAHAAGAWTAVDVGAPAIRGSAQEDACTSTTGCPVFTISGAGLGVGGTTDQFMFVHQKLTGDGTIKMRLLSPGTPTMEAGLMVRESLTGSARHVSLLVSATGAAVRSRVAAGGTTASLAVSRASWLRLERAGTLVTAWVSTDGAQWTVVSAQTQTLPATVYVGIAVSSRTATTLATAKVGSMEVAPTTPTMPSGWSSADISSAPVPPGTASYSGGSFIAASYGAGVTGSADAFRFIYTRIRGDAKLMTRVAASQGRAGRQAGIVLRPTLDSGAAETALVADDLGVVLVRRSATGQVASKTRVATTAAPVHLQLNRVGSMVTVAYSTDGTTWTTATSVPVSFGADLYAGLAVAAGPNGGVAAAAFDRLSLISVAANVPPLVSLTAPTSGKLVLEGQAVTMTATASDPDDLVAAVDFRINGVKVASDTVAPYSANWTATTAGLYSITANAADFDGAVTTSLPAAITVTPPTASSPPSSTSSTGPWRLQFTPSVDHATITGYTMEIAVAATLALKISKSLGKPPVGPDGTCIVDIDTLVAALPAGTYQVLVKAVASTGTSSSLGYVFSR